MKGYPNLAWLLLLVPAVVQAQPDVAQSTACLEPQARQFDFWIGDWDISAKSRPPGGGAWAANTAWVRTQVRAVLGGCALIEESIDDVVGDTVVVGMSLTSYNRHLRTYQQLWVDSKGFSWEYLGGREGEDRVLYLESTASNGARIVPFQPTTQIRMVFSEITETRFVWRYEYSTDAGRTWTRTSEAEYRRRNVP